MLELFSVVLISTISTTIINAAPASNMPNDCPQRLLDMDSSMKVALMITNPEQALFESEEQVNQDYCLPVMKHHQKVIANYKPCLRSFPKQIFSIVLSNSRKNTKLTCGTPQQRLELVNNLKCFTKDTYPELIQLGNHVITLVEYLSTISDVNRIIPGMCCGYHKLLSNAKVELERLCAQQGIGPSGPEYFIGNIKSAVSDAIDMMCGGYGDLEQCNKKAPELISEIDNLMIEKATASYNYTLVIPFLRVIDRIDSDTNL